MNHMGPDGFLEKKYGKNDFVEKPIKIYLNSRLIWRKSTINKADCRRKLRYDSIKFLSLERIFRYRTWLSA